MLGKEKACQFGYQRDSASYRRSFYSPPYFYPALPLVALAQAAQAELTGDVRDGSGAGVPKATVTATQTETGDVTKTTSGKDGVYTVTNLRPGLYNVTVEAQGFRRFVQEGVRLTTGERIRLDVALTVGGVNEEVKVTADASLLEDRDRESRPGHPEPPHR